MSKKVDALVIRAKYLGLSARAISNPRGGYRKHHPLGSTYSPKRVVVIDGNSFSHGGAKQFLEAREVK